MNVEVIQQALKPYAKDAFLNLGSILSEEGAPGLTLKQIWGIALSTAYATKVPQLFEGIAADASAHLSPEEVEAAKAAATIMAMNNVFYRAIHLAEDAELGKMPARLRMNVIGKSGVPKIDFDLYSLAVSALSGCSVCIKAHIHDAKKGDISLEGVQSTLRIAAVMNSVAQALAIG